MQRTSDSHEEPTYFLRMPKKARSFPDSSGVLSIAEVGIDLVVSVDLMEAAVEGAREVEGLELSSLGVDMVRVGRGIKDEQRYGSRASLMKSDYTETRKCSVKQHTRDGRQR